MSDSVLSQNQENDKEVSSTLQPWTLTVVLASGKEIYSVSSDQVAELTGPVETMHPDDLIYDFKEHMYHAKASGNYPFLDALTDRVPAAIYGAELIEKNDTERNVRFWFASPDEASARRILKRMAAVLATVPSDKGPTAPAPRVCVKIHGNDMALALERLLGVAPHDNACHTRGQNNCGSVKTRHDEFGLFSFHKNRDGAFSKTLDAYCLLLHKDE